MYTGANPGKHGIFGFSQRRPGSYRLAPTHASARKANTIFQIISDAGMKLGVLNAPATYPPEPVNGLFVPGVPVPDNAADYTHPRELAAELQSLTGGRHMYSRWISNNRRPDASAARRRTRSDVSRR